MSDQSKTNKIVWDLESDHQELAESIRTALREVKDPEIGMSIIQLGLVRNVSITDNTLVLSMILTTPYCPYGPALIEQTKIQAESVSPHPVVIALGMEPWDFSMMEEPGGFEWGIWQ